MKKLAIVFIALTALLCQATVNTVVVGTYSAVGQTASIPTTTIYTATATGMYRYVLYGETKPCPASGSVTAVINWTDENASVNSHDTSYFNCNSTNPSATWEGTPMRMVSGTPVTITVTDVNGVEYNVSVAIEKL